MTQRQPPLTRRAPGSPEVVVEPYDASDRGLIRCCDCVRQGVPSPRGGGCRNYVPALADMPQRCAGFRLLPAPARKDPRR